MRFLTATVLLFIINVACAQTMLRPGITELVDSMTAYNQYDSESVGYGGMRTEQWERYVNLSQQATSEELRELTAHKNGVIRCYAFLALAERHDSMTFSILLQHLEDKEYISTFTGCILSETKVGDFFLDVVTPDYVSLSAYKLNNKEQAFVDSMLIFNPKIDLSAQYMLLRDLQPQDFYHQRLRELAEQDNCGAVIALARFKDEKDIPVILNFFKKETDEYYAIYAVREFPHPDFYPHLTRIFEREWKKQLYDYPTWRILYQALARYNNEHTLQLFERTITVRDHFRKQTLGKYLYIAILKYPTEEYEALKPRIKLDEYYMEGVHREMDSEK